MKLENIEKAAAIIDKGEAIDVNTLKINPYK